MTDSQQLSPHRHISFTAHYTGYIWYQLGWSHPALASRRGQRLATMLHPIELLMERFVGGSMRSTLKQRHTLIDRQLDRALAQYPDAQVIEIAAGLSPRGWRYRMHNPHISYIEADLPTMANLKREALAPIEDPAPRVEAVDLFTDQWEQLIDSLDKTRPLIVISEGLINYFGLPMLKQLCQKIAHSLSQFPHGIYVSDIYPEPVHHRLANLIWNSSKLLKVLSKSAFSFHFQSPQALSTFLQEAGFGEVSVFQPAQDDTPNVTEHLGDLVWVFEARG